MSSWQKAVLQNKGKCLFYFNTSVHNTDHKMCDCSIMKKVGLKFKTRSADASRDTASCVTTKGTTPTLPTPPASTTNANPTGSATVSGAFLVSTKLETYDSGNKLDDEGKCEVAMYCASSKTNSNGIYPWVHPVPALMCPLTLSLLPWRILWFLLWGTSTIIHSNCHHASCQSQHQLLYSVTPRSTDHLPSQEGLVAPE
jgi:hypothetical protein